MRYTELPPAEGWYWVQSERQGKPSWTMAFLKSNGYLPIKLLTLGDLSMLDEEDETKWQSCETINALWLHDEDANVWRRGNQQWSGPTLWFGPIESPVRAGHDEPLVEFSEAFHQEAQQEGKMMAAIFAQNTHCETVPGCLVTHYQQLLCTRDQLDAIFRCVDWAMKDRSTRDNDMSIYTFPSRN